MFFTFTAPQYDYEKEVRRNPTQKKLDDLKKKNINRASPPRDYVESILKRLGETIDTSKMNVRACIFKLLSGSTRAGTRLPRCISTAHEL